MDAMDTAILCSGHYSRPVEMFSKRPSASLAFSSMELSLKAMTSSDEEA